MRNAALAHEVLPAVELSGFKQTELFDVLVGIYVTWAKSGVSVHLTMWRYASAVRASQRSSVLMKADGTLTNYGTVAGVPNSFFGEMTGGAGTAEAETLFPAGDYVVRVHTDENIRDHGQLVKSVTSSVYDRLTLIIGQ